MLGWLEQVNESINGVVWGPVTLFLFLATGIWFTLGTGWFQLSKIGLIFRNTLGSLGKNRLRKNGGISPFQAMSTALAGTMGVGNITGIATAMTLGGAGSIFWMWISAFFGMMTKYAEVLLAVRYRQKGASGYFGGPMYYMEKGVGSKVLAIIFSCLCIAASLGVGNMTQSNAISLATNQLWSFPYWLSGLLTALAIGLVIIGGIRRIALVTEWMIPFLSIGYLTCSILVLILRADRLPEAIHLIFSSAFTPASAAGGVAGYTVSQAMRFGFARGIFSNEAGLGSAGIAAASADASSPVQQGYISMTGAFFDTIIICTVTGLAICCSGVLGAVDASGAPVDGAALTILAFQTVLGDLGGKCIALFIVLFAFSTILGWEYQGETAFSYLTRDRGRMAYRLVYVLAVLLGARARLETVYLLSDICNALMCMPNLICLMAMSGEAAAAVRHASFGRPLRQKISV